MRLIGSIEPEARRAAGYRWFNALPAAQAIQCLLGIGLEPGLAGEIAGQRPLDPLAEAWLRDTPDHHGLAAMLEGQPR